MEVVAVVTQFLANRKPREENVRRITLIRLINVCWYNRCVNTILCVKEIALWLITKNCSS